MAYPFNSIQAGIGCQVSLTKPGQEGLTNHFSVRVILSRTPQTLEAQHRALCVQSGGRGGEKWWRGQSKANFGVRPPRWNSSFWTKFCALLGGVSGARHNVMSSVSILSFLTCEPQWPPARSLLLPRESCAALLLSRRGGGLWPYICFSVSCTL